MEPGRTANPVRSRKRPAKAVKAPGLHFITSTDPRDFKNAENLRSIRSRAMLSHVHDKKVQARGKENATDSPDSQLSGTTTSDNISGPGGFWHVGWPINTEVKPYSRAAVKKKARVRTVRRARSSSDEDDSIQVVEDDPADSAITSVMRSFVLKPPRKIGNGVDPFLCMPDFMDPKISIWGLKQKFDSVFITPKMVSVWYPMITNSKHGFLSSALIKSTYHDVLTGHVGDSPFTLNVKSEIFNLVNDNMKDIASRSSDQMISAITHLLAAEVIHGDENTMIMHENGIKRMVLIRGGLAELGGQGLVAIIACLAVLLSSIFREGAAHWEFVYFLSEEANEPMPNSKSISECPLYCPRNDYITIKGQCSDRTLDILRDMRDLTSLFLAHHETGSFAGDIDRPVKPEDDYSSQAQIIFIRTLKLPSVSDSADDWQYISVRLAALVYSYAIVHRLPFSAAANHVERLVSADRPLDATLLPLQGPFSGAIPHATSKPLPHPSILIHNAIQHTDHSQCWGIDMAGVLFWVSAVGRAAARSCDEPLEALPVDPRTPMPFPSEASVFPSDTSESSPEPTPSLASDSSRSSSTGTAPDEARVIQENQREWVRKSLAIVAMRCALVLGFEQPVTCQAILRGMIRVQRILADSPQ